MVIISAEIGLSGWFLCSASLILQWVWYLGLLKRTVVRKIWQLRGNPASSGSVSLKFYLSSEGMDMPSLFSSSPFEITGVPRSNNAMETGIEMVG